MAMRKTGNTAPNSRLMIPNWQNRLNLIEFLMLQMDISSSPQTLNEF
jgi:hypothetical protein